MTDTESQLDIIEKGPLSDEAAAEPEEKVAAETPAEEPKAADAADEDTQEETVSDDDSEEEVEEKPKPKRRNRTAKLAAKLTTAEQQIATLQQQLQELKPPPAPEVQPPKQEDFASFEEFNIAAATHAARETARQEMQGLTRQVEEATQQAQAQHLQTEWTKKESKASEKHDDYFEVVRDEDLQVTNTMADAIKQMDDGTDVAYHLGMHPDESARIAQLQPVAQVIELGRIASKLSRPKPKSTSAPNPPKTVRSNSASPGMTLENAPTMEDFARIRNEQLQKERGAGKS